MARPPLSVLDNAVAREADIARPELRQAGPLVVDLDRTLLRTDSLFECLVLLTKRKAWCLLFLPIWLLRGKAHLKRQLARQVILDVASLPVNEPLLMWLTREQAKGRPVHLVTAADELLAQQVAERFPIFNSVYGSDGEINLRGVRKLAAVQKRIGPRFTYVGDSRHDVVVWKGCRSAVLVGRTDQLRKLLSPDVEVARAFEVTPPTLSTWWRALRIHQWSKNALIFVPALLAGLFSDLQAVTAAALGFVVFGLLASSAYVVNDLLDLSADRMHRSKRHRPFASGELALRDGLIAAPVLLIAALALLPLLPPRFAIVALTYLVLTLAYSVRLKQALMLDVIVLAILFTLRVLAGIVVVSNPLSPWLLAFSMFFFLSLACMKRYGECMALGATQGASTPGRNYRPGDGPWLMAMGAAGGFCAMSTFFIYLVDGNSPVHAYDHPQAMWLICVLLGYWLSRAWALAARGEMNDDPVVFAMKDRASLALAALIVATVVLARL